VDLDALLADLQRRSGRDAAASLAPADAAPDPPDPPDPPAGTGPRVALWRSARIDPGRRGAGAMAIAAALAALAAAIWVLLDAPSGGVTHVDPVAATSAAPAGTGAASAAPSAQPVVVHVAGRVASPGVYTLPAGSRVADALAAAGGAAAGVDLSALNLARVLVDGEQIAVGIPGAADGPPVAAGGSATAAPIDLNRATAELLDALPGVGPVLAQNILAWRAEHGRFESVDQLREVSGIGEAKYAQLKDRVRV
jgi:competence protein ComEA